MKKRLQKGISLLISLLMVFSTMPLGVLAEDANAVPARVINNEDVSISGLETSEMDVPKNGNDITPVKEEQTIKIDEASGFQYQVEENQITLLGFDGPLNDLKTIAIPATIEGTTVTKIAAKIFSANTEVIKVLIPKGITEIDASAFEGCVNLEMIAVDKENPVFYDENGILYKTAKNILILKPANWKESDLPQNSNETQTLKKPSAAPETIQVAETIATTATVDGFDYSVVEGGVVITKYNILEGVDVTIPETLDGKKVIGIGDNAFSELAIKTVDFNSGLLFIGSGAFYNCDSLTTIKLPSALTTIDQYDPTTDYQGAFANCDTLEKITIPNSVTVMGPDIFKDSANVVINGSKGSSAQAYASEYSIKFAVVNLLSVSKFTTSKTSGQNINTSIKISAKATGGTGPYKYEFFYTLDNDPDTKQIIQKLSTTSSANFETNQAGTYTLYVEVTDKMGEKCLKSIDDFQIINKPSLTLTANPTTAPYVNTKITLTASVADKTGTEPFQYKFYYKLGSETETIKELSDDNTAVFTPDTAGIYTLYVDVIDKAGLTTTKSIEKYEIVAELSVNLVSDKQSPQDINTKIKLTAQGAGGKTGYQYKFYYIFGGKTVVIKNFSKINTVDFTPSEPGNYTLYVDIKNVSGKISTDSSDYIIADVPVVNSFTTDLPTGQCAGTEIKLIADAGGGSGSYTYAFSCKLGSTAISDAISQEAATDNTATFTPTKSGTYTLSVTVTDENELVSQEKIIANYKVIEPVKVLTLTASKASGQPVGTNITLKAAATGGKSPYEYQFSSTLKGGVAEVFQDYSTARTAIFAPDTAGEYAISVVIRDANGNISEPMTLDTNLKTEELDPFVIFDAPVVDSFETELPAGQFVGMPIELTAEASGGSGALTYEFSCKMGTTPLTDSDITPGPNNNDNTATATFTPSKAGTYILTVTVTDEENKTATKTITNYKVNDNVSVQSFTANKASGQNINTDITLTATGTGGKGPYQYEFTGTVDGEITVIQDYSTARTAIFAPVTAGEYTLSVTIRDANGYISEPRELTTEPYVIFDAPVISEFKPDLPSEQYVGTPIELSAAVSGGTEPLNYAFSCKLGIKPQVGSEEVISQVSVTDNIATFTPTKPGTYTLTVTVTDDAGKTATKTITNYKVYSLVAVKSFTTNKTTPQKVGAKILLTAAGTGGKAPYQYKFTCTKGGETTVIQDYSTARTAYFTPTEMGTYELTVEIKDSKGTDGTISKIASYVIN